MEKQYIFTKKNVYFECFFFSDCYVQKFIKCMPNTLHKEIKRHYEEYVL